MYHQEKYMEHSFNKITNKDEGEMKIKDHEVSKSDHFWYLGLIIHNEGIL